MMVHVSMLVSVLVLLVWVSMLLVLVSVLLELVCGVGHAVPQLHAVCVNDQTV
jgi:hypothetical protein